MKCVKVGCCKRKWCWLAETPTKTVSTHCFDGNKRPDEMHTCYLNNLLISVRCGELQAESGTSDFVNVDKVDEVLPVLGIGTIFEQVETVERLIWALCVKFRKNWNWIKDQGFVFRAIITYKFIFYTNGREIRNKNCIRFDQYLV
jgi:hypothetical protein